MWGGLGLTKCMDSALSRQKARKAELRGELEQANASLATQADKLAAMEQQLAAAQAALEAKAVERSAQEEAFGQPYHCVALDMISWYPPPFGWRRLYSRCFHIIPGLAGVISLDVTEMSSDT